MPPFIPKKRLAATPPPGESPPDTKKAKLKQNDKTQAKKAVQKPKKSILVLDSDDSDSSLSSVGSDNFEDVGLNGQSSTAQRRPHQHDADECFSDDSDQVEWESAIQEKVEQYIPSGPAAVSGDIQFSIDADDDDFGGFAANTSQRKQGISKTERATRIVAHQLHVQFLLWHNHVRNLWTSDKEVQKTLLDQLPSQIGKEVDKWKRASGLVQPKDAKKKNSVKKKDSPVKHEPSKKKPVKKGKLVNDRDERDWGRPSQRLEPGKADLSSGDPLISLLKVLSAYWKKRFAITAPGLRKRGYSTRLERRKEVESFKKGPHDPERHGERIQGIKEFREIAKRCEGSRDVGAQLFTALLRGLGIEARLVASLQPAGFGATKIEEMAPRKEVGKSPGKKRHVSSESDSEMADIDTIGSKAKATSKKRPKVNIKGKAVAPTSLDSGSSSASDSDDSSVVDITPSLPKRRPAKYDRDVPVPIYWTEAISPITNKVYPVSALILEKSVATNDDLLATFEPRGAKADKVRLVMAYVVAYSPDKTAKDVTVRYVRKHVMPGKTKAFRFPVEQLPVYDRSGKVRRYEDYDWFKRVMSAYGRSDDMRTAVDDIEDSADLIPQQPEKKLIDDAVDTLTSLKASPDFVLERFLRREEALRPDAQPDRIFASGKGDNYKEEPVYRRADVERCLTTESWHKEGRIPKLGEVPLKRVPVRAVTLTRKREAEEHERITGEKQLQGLYSWDQTEYIIPPPIRDGVIPKNGFGNIDAFVPTMIPEGAVHIKQKGCVRICKKLEIDFAEAVVGFEFGNKRAVPVIQGVVVAKENEKEVRRRWKEWHEEQKRKDAAKKQKLILDLWRKFIVGMRIRVRVQEQYGEEAEAGGSADALPARLKLGETRDEPVDLDEDRDDGANSLAPTTTPGEPAEDEEIAGGGFFLPHSDDEQPNGGELIMEGGDDDYHTLKRRKGKQRDEFIAAQYPTPSSVPVAQPRMRKRSLVQESYRDTDPAHVNGDNEQPYKPDSELFAAPLIDEGHSSSELSSPVSSESDNDEDDSDIYNPMAKRRVSARTAAAERRASARTRTRRAANQEDFTDSEKQPENETLDTDVDDDDQQAGPEALEDRPRQPMRVSVVVPQNQRNKTQTPNTKKMSGVTSPYFGRARPGDRDGNPTRRKPRGKK
jgi:xeroderma pigmentosum group C-complementing protein